MTENLSERIEIGEICSNFDHSMNYEVIEKLKKEKGSMATYPSWDFYSYVAYIDGEFVADVWCYGSCVSTLKEKSFEELKDSICDKFGNQ
jgi:hypothetical protein